MRLIRPSARAARLRAPARNLRTTSPSCGSTFRRVRRREIRKRLRLPCDWRIDAIIYPGTVAAIDIERKNEIHDVLVEPPSARRGVRSTLDHRTLDIEVARFSERHRGIDDQEVRQQQPGERVIAVPVEWPIDLAVEPVVE